MSTFGSIWNQLELHSHRTKALTSPQVSCLMKAYMSSSPAIAETQNASAEPMSLRLGTARHPIHVAHVPAMLSECRRLPVIMIHGGFHTGEAYMETPDGRDGWAPLFAARGHEVYVPDWPCHGHSPGAENITQLTTRDTATALGTLVEAVGPAIVIAHSAGGPLAWWMAETLPDKVSAVIGVAPGAPANLIDVLPDDPAVVASLAQDKEAGCPVYSPPDSPVVARRTFIRDFWANAPRFPQAAFDAYAATVVAESPNVLNERFNIGGQGLAIHEPSVVAQRPLLVITGEHDARHPRSVDQKLADYLAADFIWLPDLGINGNGHMLMIEDNSNEIALVLFSWLESKGL